MSTIQTTELTWATTDKATHEAKSIKTANLSYRITREEVAPKVKEYVLAIVSLDAKEVQTVVWFEKAAGVKQSWFALKGAKEKAQRVEDGPKEKKSTDKLAPKGTSEDKVEPQPEVKDQSGREGKGTRLSFRAIGHAYKVLKGTDMPTNVPYATVAQELLKEFGPDKVLATLKPVETVVEVSEEDNENAIENEQDAKNAAAEVEDTKMVGTRTAKGREKKTPTCKLCGKRRKLNLGLCSECSQKTAVENTAAKSAAAGK